MNKIYSKHQLFLFRNNIPIAYVIEHILQLPTKYSEGVFRFLCPICRNFITATNPNTNLARCFSCQKNFNPIDIVITTNKISFRDAITLLSPHLHSHSLSPTKASSSLSPQRPRSELTLMRDIFARMRSQISAPGSNHNE